MKAPALPPQFRADRPPPQFRDDHPPQFQQQGQPRVALSAGKGKWLIAILGGFAAAIVGVGAYVLFEGDGYFSGPSQSLPESQPQAASNVAPLPAAQAPSSPPTSTPTAPQRSERIVQDAWVINCVQASNAKKSCSGVLQVVDQEHRRPVFAWVIGRSAEGVPIFAFQTPPSVQLQKGIDLKLGASAPHRANFVMCNPQVCEAAMPINDTIIREAMAAVDGNAVATVTIINGQVLNFTMPIKGFDKVIAAVRG